MQKIIKFVHVDKYYIVNVQGLEYFRSICRLYADDSSLQQCSNNISVIENNLNYDLHVLKEWSKQWLLEFNPQKNKSCIL